MKTLTFERLTKEYEDWLNTYGNDRNDNDWRFGQYVVNIYGFDPPGLFYEENASNAYKIACHAILKI